MAARGKVSDDVAGADAIVARWTEPQRRLAAACRATVRRAIPTMYERPYPGWNAVGFRDPQAGYFAGIFPVAHGLDLVFEHGAAIEDADELFAVRPTHRQIRVVEVRTLADVRRAALAALLRRAVLHGSAKRR